MKKKIRNFKKGTFLILSFMMLGLVLQNCEDKSFVGDNATNDLTLKKATILPDGITAPDPCLDVCLVAGQHMYVGTVDVAMMDGDLYVTYNVTEPGVYLEEIHLDIFTSVDQLKNQKKVSNGGAIPGKFEFHKTWNEADMVTTFTAKIPADYVDSQIGEDNCFYIASHAALSNGETAWGGLCDESDKGVSLDNALQFPGKNWSVYFEFCKDECQNSIDFTYAFEDLNIDADPGNPSSGNDGDYNDLVVKSDVIKTTDQLKISLFAVARGAGYDHAFKIKIPKQGVVGGMSGIFGEDPVDAVVDDGNGNYIITVFPSTKAALPGEGYAPYGFAANTAPDDPNCTPVGEAEITISIDGTFPFDAAEPYDPFITVLPGTPDEYNLYIWELHQGDGMGSTWKDSNGDEYPNGIIIKSDWKWPFERVNIKEAYSGFMDIANWNSNWAVLTDPNKVFDLNCL